MTVFCNAKTRKGTPCRRPAGWGTQHHGIGRCKLHGGAEPHAQVNGLVALARREQQVMGRPLSIEPQEAILECIRIAAGEVAYASERIAELEAADAVGGVKRTLVRRGAEGFVQEVRVDAPTVHIWIAVRQQALDRLMAYSVAAVRAKIDEREVELTERMGEQLSTLFERAMAAVEGLTAAQRTVAAQAYVHEVRLLERPAIEGTAAVVRLPARGRPGVWPPDAAA